MSAVDVVGVAGTSGHVVLGDAQIVEAARGRHHGTQRVQHSEALLAVRRGVTVAVILYAMILMILLFVLYLTKLNLYIYTLILLYIMDDFVVNVIVYLFFQLYLTEYY